MSDDIVTRLRVWSSWLDERIPDTEIGNDLREAAAEIERLRLEMSIPRDEYAMTWKNLLDRIDGLDIVDWIRSYANAYSPSDYSSPIARDVVVRSDQKWMQAADEIERLRNEVERLRAGGCARDQTTTQFCAEAERLRTELAARCGGDGAGAHTAGPIELFIPEAL